MKSLSKGILFFATILFVSLNYAKSNRVVKIGTLIYNPPFEVAVVKKNSFYGFNIDIIKSVCKILAYECHLKPMRFDHLLKALDSGQVDAIIVGLSLRPKHQEYYLFSFPYFIGNAVFLTLTERKIHTLNHKTIGIVGETLVGKIQNYDLILEDNTRIKHGKNEIQLKYFPNLPELLSALNKQKVDAILLDAGAATYWVNNSSDRYQRVGPVVSRQKGMTIMTLRSQRELVSEFNKALLTMETDGQLLALYKHYWSSIHPNKKATGILKHQQKEKYKFYIPEMK